MSNFPQLPHSDDSASPSRNSSRWIDLIAFLSILALGGVLISFGSITAGSLATICAALGGLYGVWKRVQSSNETRPSVDPGGKQDGELEAKEGEQPR